MRESLVTRRATLVGATACAVSTAFPTPAAAFIPALAEGLKALLLLWSAVKMVEEVYERFPSAKKQKVTNEVVRIYSSQQVIINNYYQFGNPYNAPRLGRAELGCECMSRQLQENSTYLIAGTPEDTVSLPTGCIIALDFAAKQLRRSHSEDNIFAYTRPFRRLAPAQPWSLDPSGTRLQTDIQYYSVSGSVKLRWVITDRLRRTCRGQYFIRDDYSKRIVVEGVTPEFLF